MPDEKWQPIDTAPKDGRLLHLRNGDQQGVGWWAEKLKFWAVSDTATRLGFEPTEWKRY